MANINPIFVGTPALTTTIIQASSTRDASTGTTYQLLVSNTTSVSRVDRITVMAGNTFSTNSSNALRVYITEPSGVNPRLFREQLLAAAVPSATVLGSTTTFTFTGGLIMGTSSEIWVGQQVYGGVNDKTHWICEGGHF